jgi:hypothetical protein
MPQQSVRSDQRQDSLHLSNGALLLVKRDVGVVGALGDLLGDLIGDLSSVCGCCYLKPRLRERSADT